MVYNTGESEDSVPIIASLDSGPSASNAAGDVTSTGRTAEPAELELEPGREAEHTHTQLLHDGVSRSVTDNQFQDQRSGNDSDSAIPAGAVCLDVKTQADEPSHLGSDGAVLNRDKFLDSRPQESPRDDSTCPSEDRVYKVSHILHALGSDDDGGSIGISSCAQSIFRNLELDTANISNDSKTEPLSSILSAKLVDPGASDLVEGSGLTEQKGDSDGNYGQMKPSLDQPTRKEVPRSVTQEVTTTALLPGTSWSTATPADPHVHTTSDQSLQDGVGLLQPTTTNLFVDSSSTAALPPMASYPISTTTESLDVSSRTAENLSLSSGQSAELNEALIGQTKQPPPLSSSTGVATQGEGLNHTSSLQLGPSSKIVDSATADSCGVYTSTSDPVMAVIVDYNPNISPPQPSHEGSQTAGASSMMIEVGQSASLSGSTSVEGGFNANSTSAEQTPNANANHHGTTCSSGSHSINTPRDGGPRECKQTGKLLQDSEKCFEAGKSEHSMPRTHHHDSIISLTEPTAMCLSATSNTQHSGYPLEQTMPLAPFKGQSESLAAMSTGGDVGQQEMGRSNDPSSVQMASVLLSQLESELANSLNEDN